MKWLRSNSKLLRRSTPGVVVTMVLIALVGTIFGLGATGQSPNVFDGSAWLWSRSDGAMTLVSANSGNVDLTQPVVDSRGHQLQVTQNDQYLLLHDLDTGRVTSVDLIRMGFSGSLSLGVQSDIIVALNGTLAAVVDRTRGMVRAVDPATLQVKGDPLQLPAPLVGGYFDGSGTLWVGLPGQGTVVGLSADGDSVAARVTVPVTQPGHDLVISALDKGVLAVDRSSNKVLAVIGNQLKKITSPVALAGALVPERTVGSLVAVTVPAAQAVITTDVVDKHGPVNLLPLQTKDAAVPFAGRVYVPNIDGTTLHVYDANGKLTGNIAVKDAKGKLELQVREQHLFINAQDSPFASVIDSHGKVQVVEKYGPDTTSPGPTGSPSAGRSHPGGPAVVPSPSSTGGPGTKNGGGGSSPIPANTNPPKKPEPPGAPVPLTALAGDAQVSLNWGRAAPGSAPVTHYTVVWSGGSRTVGGNTLHTVITGLTNGKSYRFRVTATNRYGDGPPAVSGLVTPVDGSPPDAPNQPTAIAAPDSVKVTWPAVADAKEYVVTPLRDGAAGADPEQRVPGIETDFTGLKFGSTYTFTVVAVDSQGRASGASPASNAVVPFGVPSAPGSVGGKQIGANTFRITWTAAADNGKPITKYVVADAAGNKIGTAAADARSLDVTATALTQVQVAAESSAGRGKWGSGPVTAIAAPTVKITATSATTAAVTVKFTVNAGGGKATCKITLAPTGKSATGCSGSTTFTGLSAGTTYTITVTATNQVGTATAKKQQMTMFRGTVTCVDKPTNPDPVYCTGTGGIGVATSPVYSPGNAVKRLMPGTKISVVCRATGSDMYAYVYNKYKRSNIWLKMSDGLWIPWVWVTLSNGDNVKAVPTC